MEVRLLSLRVFAGSVLALVAPALMSAVPSSLEAMGSFDGAWMVLITPESGVCDQNLTLPVQVTDGRISSAIFLLTATGSVSGRGAVEVHFIHAADRVDGNGNIAGTRGSGRWSSATLKCSGHWTADRTG
jgi:hypothetical protein